MIEKLFLVAIGGACGAMLRFLSVSAFARMMGDVAWGTFFVNVVGSLVMGLSVAILVERFPDSAERFIPLITIGLLGGFTTFSAFSLDAIRLIEEGRISVAAVYISGSVVLSILALTIGLMIGRTLN